MHNISTGINLTTNSLTYSYANYSSPGAFMIGTAQGGVLVGFKGGSVVVLGIAETNTTTKINMANSAAVVAVNMH